LNNQSPSSGPKAGLPFSVPVSESFKKELARELVAANPENEDDLVSCGIGIIKMGDAKALPGWVKLFMKSDVFVVSLERDNPKGAFVMGTGHERTVAVFTRFQLAEECLNEFKALKCAFSIKGADLLELAKTKGVGVWINPLNQACSLKIPANMVRVFLEEGLSI
jgi:hypothetical protein